MAKQLILNETGSNPIIHLQEYSKWFSLEPKNSNCQITQYSLFKDTACLIPDASNIVWIKDTSVILDENSPTTQPKRTYLCATTTDSLTAFRPLDYHVCGSELIGINKTKGERIDLEY